MSTKLQLLVDAPEFWAALRRDIRAARHRIWLQTLSFEADSAGLPLAEALLESDDARLDALVASRPAFFTALRTRVFIPNLR